MPPKGSSNRAVIMQATAAAKNTSNQQATTAETTRRSSPRKNPRQRSTNVEVTTDAAPAVMVELAEEEGDQTPYFNTFQR
jgi:hypothetical protein